MRAHFDPKAPLKERGKLLKGLTIAVGGIGAIPDIVLKVVQTQAGLSRDNVTATPMQPPEYMAAFQRKAIDGFVSGPPFIQQAVVAGHGRGASRIPPRASRSNIRRNRRGCC